MLLVKATAWPRRCPRLFCLQTDLENMSSSVRKLALKYTFRLDAKGIKTRLLPHQLAVAIAGGPEILVHSARDWIAQNKGREDMILLQKDISNAYNTVLPSVFLEEYRQYAPASSRFAA